MIKVLHEFIQEFVKCFDEFSVDDILEASKICKKQDNIMFKGVGEFISCFDCNDIKFVLEDMVDNEKLYFKNGIYYNFGNINLKKKYERRIFNNKYNNFLDKIFYDLDEISLGHYSSEKKVSRFINNIVEFAKLTSEIRKYNKDNGYLRSYGSEEDDWNNFFDTNLKVGEFQLNQFYKVICNDELCFDFFNIYEVRKLICQVENCISEGSYENPDDQFVAFVKQELIEKIFGIYFRLFCVEKQEMLDNFISSTIHSNIKEFNEFYQMSMNESGRYFQFAEEFDWLVASISDKVEVNTQEYIKKNKNC